MVRTGVVSLDELKAVRMAVAILSPFESVSPQTSFLVGSLRVREKALLDSPALHDALRSYYGYECRFITEAQFRSKGTSETRAFSTCSNPACLYLGEVLDPDGPPAESEHCRVDLTQLELLLR